MTTFCNNCGTQAVDDNSVFCNNCGSKLIQNIPKINDTTNVGETIHSNKDSPQLASDIVNRSQKPRSLKPLKRTSMVLPAILFLVAFVFILLVLSQSGILGPLFSIGSTNASQEDRVVPAQVTLTIPPPVATAAPTSELTENNPSVTSTSTANSPPTLKPTIMSTKTVAPKSYAGTKNIVETAEADGRFTTFVAAVKAAGLNDTLSGTDALDTPSMFTVFAPTDDAFNKLSAGSMDTLLKDPQGALLQILLYHVIQGKVTSADLKKLTSVETLQGGSLPISVSNGVVTTVDGANVIITDIECSNGMIHVVDTVMLPPA